MDQTAQEPSSNMACFEIGSPCYEPQPCGELPNVCGSCNEPAICGSIGPYGNCFFDAACIVDQGCCKWNFYFLNFWNFQWLFPPQTLIKSANWTSTIQNMEINVKWIKKIV